MSNRPLVVLFMPESAYGPTGNCIGIGDVLRQRGHRVVFAAEASWEGKLAALGFDEDLVALAPVAEQSDGQDAGQFWKNFIRDTAPEFRKPTIEQLASFIQPTWQALIDGAVYCQAQLKDIVQRQQPDVIVEDNVLSFPALLISEAPFVRIMSCNPLEVKGPNVPPTFSGLSSVNSAAWNDFRAEYRRTHAPMWRDFNDFVQSQGAPPLPELEFMHTSPHANLYVYPREADYTHNRPLGAEWHRIDSSVRQTDSPFELPDLWREGEHTSGLVYLSLGSLGSADVELMRRLIDVLGRTPHRYIVSMGPQHDQLRLADNMWGAEFLPQTSVLPLVDLVITHGGNNTTTEALHFGKPMVVLPLFWDQYDNAQRVDELGFGRRLATYEFTEAELTSAVDDLLRDLPLRERMASLGEAIRARPGVRGAADVIEELGCRFATTGAQ